MGHPIRRAVLDDVQQLAGFKCYDKGRHFTREVERAIQVDVVDAIRENTPGFQAFVAEIEGQIAGVVATTDQMGERIRHISVLAVAHAFRRRYIGTELKQLVIDTATADGMREVTSSIHQSNIPIKNLNHKLGVVWSKDPEDKRNYFFTVATLPSRSLFDRAKILVASQLRN